MNTNLVTFTPDTELFKAIDIMLKRHISGAPVLDKDGQLVGTLSEWDCLKRILHGSYYEEVGGMVRDYLRPTEEVNCIGPNDDIVDVAESMTQNNRHRTLLVMENKRLVGILSCPDILKVIYDFDTGNL
ncbi:MAG: CBS domain-containing protein [Motiliproteus sp.]